MLSRHYVAAYAVLMALALVPAIAVLAISGRAIHGITFIVVFIVAAVFPAVAIWLARKMGYPIGQPIHCARCGAEQPMFRKPANRTQALWGGYTCAKCGAELDRNGRERVPQAGRP